jgi:5-methylcytosine-specific restriction endonuclease McrA
MYISKKDRETIKNKFGGKCAYTGTDLKEDWQVEHIVPLIRNWWTNTAMFPDAHKLDNMVPVQKIVNHYKGSLDLETFRTWFLGKLHERLKKVPKNPKVQKSKKKKEYILEVARLFDISEDKPFSGRFYFETLSANGG